jgi:hypothetical protein
LDNDARVKELINEDTSWWNVSLAKENFNEDEAKRIWSMAIRHNRQTDQLIWIGKSTREFSMKSAYHMEKSIFLQASGESSSSSNSNVWKRFCNLSVPRVVKGFLWKPCYNLLPTKENLFKKRITKYPLCPICGDEVQNICHIMWRYIFPI